jgi:hypothetical protein
MKFHCIQALLPCGSSQGFLHLKFQKSFEVRPSPTQARQDSAMKLVTHARGVGGIEVRPALG